MIIWLGCLKLICHVMAIHNYKSVLHNQVIWWPLWHFLQLPEGIIPLYRIHWAVVCWLDVQRIQCLSLIWSPFIVSLLEQPLHPVVCLTIHASVAVSFPSMIMIVSIIYNMINVSCVDLWNLGIPHFWKCQKLPGELGAELLIPLSYSNNQQLSNIIKLTWKPTVLEIVSCHLDTENSILEWSTDQFCS